MLGIVLLPFAAAAAPAGAGPKGAGKDGADALKIFEKPLARDVALPDACETWKRKAVQCFFIPKGPSYRDDSVPGLSLPASLDRLKDMGVSDVVWQDRAFRSIIRDGPHPKPVALPAEIDRVLTEAAQRDMHVWVFLNWNTTGVDFASRSYRETIHNLIDALAAKKAAFPNFVGTWWDEIWCGMARNPFAEHIETFQRFTKREFGEAYPGVDMPPKADPADKWWRRYLVFKYCIYEQFAEDLAGYSREQGLLTMPFLVNTHRYRRGWRWGHDRYRQSKIGDYPLAATYYKNPMPVESSMMHLQADFGGFAFTQVVRGRPVEHWTYTSMLGNPELQAKCREVYALAEEWLGAKPMEEVAVLIHPVALMGLFLNAEVVFRDNEELIQQTLACHFATRMLDIRDTRFFPKYRVLVVPKYAAWSVPQFALDALMDFARNGGAVLVLDGQLTAGRRDLTDPKPGTEQVAGVRLGEEQPLQGAVRLADLAGLTLDLAEGSRAAAVSAVSDAARPIAFCGERPVGFERAVGEGKVVSLYVDAARQLAADRARWGYALSRLVVAQHRPALTVEGGISLQGVIRKGERLLASFYTGAGPTIPISTEPTQVPEAFVQTQDAAGIVRVDLPASGIERAQSQVFRLSTCRPEPGPAGPTWDAASLRAGLPVAISEKLGFEILVIEPPGTPRHSTLAAELARAEVDRQRLLETARAKPPIAYEPLTARVRLSAEAGKSGAPWQCQARTHRLRLLVPSPGRTHAGEPIVIPGRALLPRLGGANVNRGSFALRRPDPVDAAALPVQATCLKPRGAPGAARDGDAFTEDDELVFVADLAQGANEFLLYYGPDAAPGPAESAIKIAPDKDRLTVHAGVNRLEFGPRGAFAFHGAEDEAYLLSANMVSPTRFDKIWQSPTPFEVVAAGPAEAVVRRTVRGRLLGPEDSTTGLFRIFANSPCVYVKLSSTARGKGTYLRFPGGRLFPGKDHKLMRRQCRVLTAEGWVPPGFASRRFRDDFKTVVTFDAPDAARSFGLLVASCTFPFTPRWLIEGSGVMWLQPARLHCCREVMDQPTLEYLFLNGVKTIAEIDVAAERFRASLPIRVGPVEQRPAPE